MSRSAASPAASATSPAMTKALSRTDTEPDFSFDSTSSAKDSDAGMSSSERSAGATAMRSSIAVSANRRRAAVRTPVRTGSLGSAPSRAMRPSVRLAVQSSGTATDGAVAGAPATAPEAIGGAAVPEAESPGPAVSRGAGAAGSTCVQDQARHLRQGHDHRDRRRLRWAIDRDTRDANPAHPSGRSAGAGPGRRRSCPGLCRRACRRRQ